MAKFKVIRGKTLIELDYMIYRSTAGLFATMLNPDMRGPNFKFISTELARMSFNFGFNATQFSEKDQIQKYSFDKTYISIEVYWKTLAETIAQHLITSSGINQEGTWNKTQN